MDIFIPLQCLENRQGPLNKIRKKCNRSPHTSKCHTTLGYERRCVCVCSHAEQIICPDHSASNNYCYGGLGDACQRSPVINYWDSQGNKTKN